MYLADCHLHTHHSPDSEAAFDDIARAACAAGLSAVTVTDHVEMGAFIREGYVLSHPASLAETAEAAERWRGRLTILRGVELGEPLENLTEAEKLLDAPLDFVPASLHNLPGIDDFYFLNYGEWDIPRLLDQYFAQLLGMVHWGRFDSLAHLTYPFRYLPPRWREEGYGRWQECIDTVLSTLAEKGLALEINVSGLRQEIGRTLPDLPIIRRFRELGGEWVTVGSDAHRPEDVGRHIQDGLALAAEAGFRYYAVYENRTPQAHSLKHI